MGCVSSCACKTIKDGEVYAVSNRSGKVQVVKGPTWKSRCGNFFEELPLVVAQEDEYIVVKFVDGRTEFKPGPCSVVQHPVDHASVTKELAIRLSEQELIVVYRKVDNASDSSESVRRELVRGPCIYIPRSASEWTHEFAWTGAADSERRIDKHTVKSIGALKFTKMRHCPSKTYVDVDKVRTKDNALLTLKLMIFFRFESVEQMLDNTNDPFGDMINAVTADVIEWCAPKKFDDFLVATDALNKMEIYQQLISSTKKIGMEIEKVVFRGYDAPVSLQQLHDKAIEKRTAMALAKEADEEEQRQVDFKLRRETERAEQQSKLEMGRCHHELEIKRKTAEAEQLQKKAEYEIELNRLREIKALDPNTDIGKYLIAKECQLPPVVQCATMMSSSGSAAGQADSAQKGLAWFR